MPGTSHILHDDPGISSGLRVQQTDEGISGRWGQRLQDDPGQRREPEPAAVFAPTQDHEFLRNLSKPDPAPVHNLRESEPPVASQGFPEGANQSVPSVSLPEIHATQLPPGERTGATPGTVQNRQRPGNGRRKGVPKKQEHPEREGKAMHAAGESGKCHRVRNRGEPSGRRKWGIGVTDGTRTRNNQNHNLGICTIDLRPPTGGEARNGPGERQAALSWNPAPTHPANRPTETPRYTFATAKNPEQ